MDVENEQRPPPQVEMQIDWPGSGVMTLEMVVAVVDSA